MFPRGAQLRLANGSIKVRVTDDGRVEMDPVSPELRVEMWSHWLHEAVDGAVAALDAQAAVAAEVKALAGPTPPPDEQGAPGPARRGSPGVYADDLCGRLRGGRHPRVGEGALAGSPGP